jgi:hypothetical protein
MVRVDCVVRRPFVAAGDYVEIEVAITICIEKKRGDMLSAIVRYPGSVGAGRKFSVLAGKKKFVRLPSRTADKYVIGPVAIDISDGHARSQLRQFCGQQKLTFGVELSSSCFHASLSAADFPRKGIAGSAPTPVSSCRLRELGRRSADCCTTSLPEGQRIRTSSATASARAPVQHRLVARNPVADQHRVCKPLADVQRSIRARCAFCWPGVGR